ncbi:MAG: hypothetical protein AAFR28_03630 [Pseudomonadota bacterium]
MSFIFGGSTGETPASIQRRRELAEALRQANFRGGRMPTVSEGALEGLGGVLGGWLDARNDRREAKAQTAANEQIMAALGGVFGGGAAPAAAMAPEAAAIAPPEAQAMAAPPPPQGIGAPRAAAGAIGAPPRAVGMSAEAPRGLRNNNPGNIEYGDFAKSRGATGTDGRFAQFETSDDGIRAMADLLGIYQKRHGLNTVGGIIDRWAPPSENDSSSYAGTVAKRMGVAPDQQIDVTKPKTAASIIEQMIRVENGQQPFSQDQIMQALGGRQPLPAAATGRQPPPPGATGRQPLPAAATGGQPAAGGDQQLMALLQAASNPHASPILKSVVGQAIERRFAADDGGGGAAAQRAQLLAAAGVDPSSPQGRDFMLYGSRPPQGRGEGGAASKVVRGPGGGLYEYSPGGDLRELLPAPTTAEGAPVKVTEGERKAGALLRQAEPAMQTLQGLFQGGYDGPNWREDMAEGLQVLPLLGPLIRAGQGNDTLTYRQAIDTVSDMILRLETGAAQTNPEIARKLGQIRITSLDPPEVVQQKLTQLQSVMESLRVAAGRAAPPEAEAPDAAAADLGGLDSALKGY